MISSALEPDTPNIPEWIFMEYACGLAGLVTAGQPLPQTEVSIRSPEDNRALPIGEVGEICARSYAVMIGYNDNPEATAAAIDDDGCLHTGDLGTMDTQGFVRVTGRVKDMIIRGGENHFPAEIEAVLVTHPHVT